MDLLRVIAESVTADERERWAQWLRDGGEQHDFARLRELTPGRELVYCEGCWTVFSRPSELPVLPPVNPDVPFDLSADASLHRLREDGLSAEELELRMTVRAAIAAGMESYVQAALRAVEQTRGVDVAKHLHSMTEERMRELERVMRPILERLALMTPGTGSQH